MRAIGKNPENSQIWLRNCEGSPENTDARFVPEGPNPFGKTLAAWYLRNNINLL